MEHVFCLQFAVLETKFGKQNKRLLLAFCSPFYYFRQDFRHFSPHGLGLGALQLLDELLVYLVRLVSEDVFVASLKGRQ